MVINSFDRLSLNKLLLLSLQKKNKNEKRINSYRRNSWFNINQNNANLSLEILDITGKIVKHLKLPYGQNSITLTVSELHDGIYIVKGINENVTICTTKLTILK